MKWKQGRILLLPERLDFAIVPGVIIKGLIAIGIVSFVVEKIKEMWSDVSNAHNQNRKVDDANKIKK